MLLVGRLAEHIARHLSTNADCISQFVCSWYMYSWPWAHKRSMCLRLSRSKNIGIMFLYSVQSSVTKCHVTLPCIPKAIFDLCDAWPISCDSVGKGHMLSITIWLKQGVPKCFAVCHPFFFSYAKCVNNRCFKLKQKPVRGRMTTIYSGLANKISLLKNAFQ